MYPRELNLSQDVEERLKSYLDEELLNHDTERGPWKDNILQWQKDYWAEPSTKRAIFPFHGASTIIIPLTAISVEAIHSRVITTIFAVDQIVSAAAKNSQWSELARPVERFMNQELKHPIELKKKVTPAILSIIKYGTGVAKVGYERIVRKAVRSVGEIEQDIAVTIKHGSVVDSIPLTGFKMPFSAQDPQTAPWCGEEHVESPFIVKQMMESGLFRPDTMETLKGWINAMSQTTTGRENFERRAMDEKEKKVPTWPKTLDWDEIWLSFDVDGDGREEEIVVHYHRGARFLMSVRYNWYHDLHRPYRTGVYFPLEFRWTGIGIGKQNEQFQREITAQHRQRLDNATLANMRMIKISKLSGYGPGEPIFPGKMWFLDNMDHMDTVQMGEVYNSAFANEQGSLIYSQQRTGVNEVTLGQPVAGTPGTATGDLARIQEGNKKFDFAFSNIKDFLQFLITDIAVNTQQFGPRELSYWELGEGGRFAQMFFSMPPDIIRDALVIELNIVGQQHNKILDRQNWVQIATILTQYYTGMLQLAQFTGNAELLQYITQRGIVAGTEAMRQVLETFEVRNVDRIILSELLRDEVLNGGNGGNQRALPSGEPNQQGIIPGATQGSPNPGEAAGVEQFASIIQSLRGLGEG